MNKVMKNKTSDQEVSTFSEDKAVSHIETENKQPEGSYKLGGKYGDIYFTRREADCMGWLLKGKTIRGVGIVLNISPRTVEYYIKNMKKKIGCRTKSELIELVYMSDLVKNTRFQK